MRSLSTLAIQLLETPEERVLGVDPATGIEVIARPGTLARTFL